VNFRVLLVEDDNELRRTLKDTLQVEGYRVVTAATLHEARAILATAVFQGDLDLVLLDLGLPDGEGESLLGSLREQRQTAVIVISARHSDDPKIRLLDAGADDYLVKPFSVKELLARMRVALRHRGAAAAAPAERYVHDELLVDVPAHRVTRRGEPVHLTPTEFKLLARLIRSAGQVVTHRQLLADVWGAEYIEHTHYLRLYMGQLRAKLEDDPADPRRLLTEPGVGYRLAEPTA
jgi:two-component system, OmpR family, KDP operon response regulator KdpE